VSVSFSHHSDKITDINNLRKGGFVLVPGYWLHEDRQIIMLMGACGIGYSWWSREREKKKKRENRYSHQGHVPTDTLTLIKPHLLKFLEPPNYSIIPREQALNI
jgi:hypothetical protein